MRSIRVVLTTGMTIVSLALLAQSKGEMPFTSSSDEAKKLLRRAWIACGDAKFDEAGNDVREALKKDSEFGMGYAFIHTENAAEREQNLEKALRFQLSSDEKMLIDGLLAAQRQKPVADYFEPLLAKYPRDYYLNLWIMFSYHNAKRSAEIGEGIIKRNPKFAPAYNMLGYDYMAQGDLKNAEKSFDKYISLRPDLANAYDSKAEYLMRVGKTEEAIAAYEKAAELGMAPSGNRADVAKTKLKYPAPSDKDKQEITKIINAFSAAYVTGDVDAILKHYSGQSIELLPNQMVNAGIANIRKRIEDIFKYGSFTRMERKIESIEGAGPIALVLGRTESAYKSGSNGDINEMRRQDIFLFRKQQDDQWKIIAHHWVPVNGGAKGQPSEDISDLRAIVNKWSFFVKPGEILSQEHVENLAAIHSPQAVEIYPDQRSNIGMANLRLRWGGFVGIKWAQFTGISFDINAVVPVGEKGFARKAVAWGIGDHSFYPPGSDELSKYLFPWAMILTKEDDNQWRILVYHWYLE